jgi:hypothetical protein
MAAGALPRRMVRCQWSGIACAVEVENDALPGIRWRRKSCGRRLSRSVGGEGVAKGGAARTVARSICFLFGVFGTRVGLGGGTLGGKWVLKSQGVVAKIEAGGRIGDARALRENGCRWEALVPPTPGPSPPPGRGRGDSREKRVGCSGSPGRRFACLGLSSFAPLGRRRFGCEWWARARDGLGSSYEGNA